MNNEMFSRTSLPPVVRVCDSGDAPFRVAQNSALPQATPTVSIIGVHTFDAPIKARYPRISVHIIKARHRRRSKQR